MFILHQWHFGPDLHGFVECPQCREHLEFTWGFRRSKTSDRGTSLSEVQAFSVDGFDLRFRPPNSRDLIAAAACPDPRQARQFLVQRCLQDASREGTAISFAELPEADVDSVGESIGGVRSVAGSAARFGVPGLRTSLASRLLDIVTFLWEELTAQAKRLLREVHTLARAYGWREADILALSARRRRVLSGNGGRMTDFLTRLAERTLGLTPQVRPLVASRFSSGPFASFLSDTVGVEQYESETSPPARQLVAEPQPSEQPISTLETIRLRRDSKQADAKESLASDLLEELDAQETIPLHNMKPTPVSSTTPTSSTRPPLKAPGAESENWPTADSLPHRQSGLRQTSSALRPERCPEASSVETFLAPHKVMESADQLEHQPLAHRVGEPSAIAPRRVDPRDGDLRTSSVLLSQLLQPGSEATNAVSGLVNRLTVETVPPRADGVRPLPPRIDDLDRLGLSANESVPPVIRVTIGRIEVRAIMPPAPVERPATTRTSPVVSLDQYLKQHSGSKR